MKLEHLKSLFLEDSLSLFAYTERYLNKGSRTYSTFADHIEGNPNYHPISPIAAFEIPCLIVPKEQVSIFLDKPHAQISTFFISDNTVVFPIHPDVFNLTTVDYIQELKKYPYTSPLLVSPTASTRTVLKRNHDPYFIKLHYPKRISRFNRRLRINTIQHCIKVSEDLATLNTCAYLPETLGVAFGTGKNAWGFIIRELNPRPYLGANILIPLFALYSQDSNHVDDLPLLVQLIHYLKADPKEFLLNHIMKPLIHLWCEAATERGILLEIHGQNSLIELNTHLHPLRVVYRDLDAYVDKTCRTGKSLPTNFPESHMFTEDRCQALYSLQYDSFLGHHLLEYLAEVTKKYFGVQPTELKEECARYFHKRFKKSNAYFTDRVFYYSNEISSENIYQLIENKNVKPQWR